MTPVRTPEMLIRTVTCHEGFATKGEVVVGGSTCAVGGVSRKMVKVGVVEMVPYSRFTEAADANKWMFTDAADYHSWIEEAIAEGLRISGKHAIGTLIKIR